MAAASARPAAVAGAFYPGTAAALQVSLDEMLATAANAELSAQPKALIVPHAGYVYSGSVAAKAYALLRPWAADIHRVVMFGPAHRVRLDGLATPSCAAFRTPLGLVSVDQTAIAGVSHLPQVQSNDAAHASEHCLEVQLPFLQAMLADFAIVPFVVGNASAGQVAEVMELLWGGPETLVLVSSDLSHYLAYPAAQSIDRSSVDAILRRTPLTHYDQACGATPINGLIEVARRHNLDANLLDLRNSGDTAGDKSRVVGYAAFAFSEPTMNDILGKALLTRARNAIAGELGLPAAPEPDHPALHEHGAVFVTLTQHGQLRGCIGSLEAWQALDADVRANAKAAAFRDPRFPPLTAAELATTRVEVSLLTPPTPITFVNQQDALQQLRPGRDGVILEYDGHRGTFLPQVWDSLSERHVFLTHLKHKAGLPADFWAPGLKLYRYEVQKWKEP